MSRVLAVFRRELAGAFDSPVAPVTAFLFVLALDGLFFFAGYSVGSLRLPAFWEGREATLRALFVWLPLLYVVLIPALSMGAWAEERRSGTEELLLTLPIRTHEAVLGKFLALWLLVALLLLVAVLPVALVVDQLGPLDWGTVWGGLAGAALLAGTCTALCVWASALAAEQLIGFLLGSVLLAALWGLPAVARVLPASMAAAVHYAGPTTHFLESGALGVFDLRDLVYHGLLAVLGLYLAATAVEGRRYRAGGAV